MIRMAKLNNTLNIKPGDIVEGSEMFMPDMSVGNNDAVFRAQVVEGDLFWVLDGEDDE